MSSRTVGWLAGGLAALLVLSSLTWGLVHATQHSPGGLAGRAAPQLAIASLQNGHMIRLADLSGTPVVLDFWASWCVPCRQEQPVLNDAARQYDGRVRFLGADFRDNDRAARAYLAQFQVPYPAGPIARGSERDYGVTGPPETYFIDRQGRVVLHVSGPIDAKRLALYLELLRP